MLLHASERIHNSQSAAAGVIVKEMHESTVIEHAGKGQQPQHLSISTRAYR